jgi:hypothetical protein
MGQEPWELVLQKLDSLEGKVDRTNANVTSMQTDVKMIQADLARTNTLAEKHERVIRGGNGDGVGVDFFFLLHLGEFWCILFSFGATCIFPFPSLGQSPQKTNPYV